MTVNTVVVVFFGLKTGFTVVKQTEMELTECTLYSRGTVDLKQEVTAMPVLGLGL